MNTPADFAPWLGVFETLRVIDGKPLFFAEHQAELARAMEALGLKTGFDFERARTELPRLSGRWRWIVKPGDTRTLFTEGTIPPADPVALSVSPVRVGSANWDARFKTVSYLSHAQAWTMASTPEVVLLNEHGHVASAARGNLFWRRKDRVCTPAHEAGCRCGVVRAFVLGRLEVEIGHFPLSHLQEAEEIFLTSSIRGIASVNALPGCALADFSTANKLRAAYEEAIVVQLEVQP